MYVNLEVSGTMEIELHVKTVNQTSGCDEPYNR
jgi:hypothetical protein